MPQQTEENVSKAISKFHKIIYKNKAFQKVKELTGIDIDKQSQKNILALYKRLRNGSNLPTAMYENIRKEKIQANDILSPSELIFFKELLKLPFIANHASEQVDTILATGANLYSKNQLEKHRINVSTHTGNEYGQNRFVFFSYGLPGKLNVVNFVGTCDVFTVNIDALMHKDPVLTKGMWSSGHFYAYDQEQIAMPNEYSYLGVSTRVYTRYEVSFNPLTEYKRHYVFETAYGITQQTLSREEEISSGRHLKPFHLLRLIELIRFFDPQLREAILARGH